MRRLRWALAALLVIGAATAASAQTGGLKVKVTDEDNLPLPGATVTISNELGYIKESSSVTDGRGVVDFPVLRPGGAYTITVNFPGYSPIRSDALRVRINQMIEVPVQMIAAIEERVKVTAERQVIDLDKSENSTKFNDDFIADLPVAGRQYQSVLTLAPGVQDPDGDGNPVVHGSRSRDFQTSVSGVNNTDPLTGRWMSRVNPNSIEEMEVITAGAGVEFGRAQGGFATIIQKQGSNEHEGVFEFYLETSKLNKDGAKSRSALPLAEFETNKPLFQLSGPVIRDKLWYRASHEISTREDPVVLTTGTEIVTTNQDTHSDQLTWQVSPRNKLMLVYSSDPLEVNNAGISRTTPSAAAFDFERSGDTISLQWDAPYSPKVFVQTTAGWQDLTTTTRPTQLGVQNDCVTPTGGGDEFLGSASCFNAEEVRRSGSWFRTEENRSQRFSLKSQATIFAGRFWGMDHQFKLGMSVENERYFRYRNDEPSMNFFVVASPDEDPDGEDEQSPEPFGISIVRLSVPRADDVRATGTNWGFFAEDQFRPTSNLTITAGFRVDREELNSEGQGGIDFAGQLNQFQQATAPISEGGEGLLSGNVWPATFTGFEGNREYLVGLQSILCDQLPADQRENCRRQIASGVLGLSNTLFDKRRADNINIVNTNFSPRMSVAWSPWSNGKTAFRLSAGRNYNFIPLIVPLQELQPATTNIRYDIDLGTGAAQRNSSIQPVPNVGVVSRNLETPYQDEIVFSIERELWAETSMKVSYISRAFRKQIQDINLNVGLGDYGRCVVQNNSSTAPVDPSPGSGFEITDPWTGVTYIDTDPGPGDGLIDDCVGEAEAIELSTSADPDPFGTNRYFRQRADGIDDLYVQNPFWGDVFEIGNYNSADYTGYVLELTRRQYRNWEMQASYAWSETIGDGEDFFQAIGDDPSLRDNVRGYQSSDQRHVVKMNATTITPWGVRLGTAVTWQSGLPYSILLARPSTDVLPISTRPITSGGGVRTRQQYRNETGFLPRNAGRNESYWNVDLKATKELTIGKNVNLQLSAEIFNALADDTFVVYDNNAEAGFEVNQQADGFYRFGRRWQVGMKLAF